MPFDTQTRNRLGRLVTRARELITSEFAQQLQSIYGIADSGEVTPLSELNHLDEEQRALAEVLRDRVEYLKSASADEKNPAGAAVDRLTREQAFTVLNRIAAMRMAEDRGFVLESVSRGYQSKGFQVYSQVAGSGMGDTYHRYRRYLFCIFDELAVDLGALFDRRSPAGLLFPRETALLALFQLINAPEIETLWTEDETIGWIYQYYNDETERKHMREKSAAPRTSRELAVRNQFFTPRYVVEFLVDNTLARIWYEARKGQTTLKELCRCLVRRPYEVFLAAHDSAPASGVEGDNLSSEDILKQPAYIPHRPKKDPRDLKILDPACGSGHFLLYSFDLLETIYEEAWADEEQVPSELTRKSIREDFHDLRELRKAVPELILRYNLHGIDIDLRACQIAALALWLRAQRTYQRLTMKAEERPDITRSNIVCAEPMPGERKLLEQFMADLQPRVLGQLVTVVFEKMKLAGEAGTLLKIEYEIADAVAEARRLWLSGPKSEQGRLFAGDMKPEQTEFGFDVTGITDEKFWEKAEENIYATLESYAERANGHGYQRRLFAGDAARGFAFIDICRKRYDIVLMNPPFGEQTDAAKLYSRVRFPDSGEDIDAAFVDRGVEVLLSNGKLGAIANRTELFKGVLSQWRHRLFYREATPDALVDLGYGVLDGAVVEAAAYVLARAQTGVGSGVFIRALDTEDKEERLRTATRAALTGTPPPNSLFIQRTGFFGVLPGKRIAYWISPAFSAAFTNFPALEENYGYARQGLASADNFRFVRLFWEPATEEIRGFDIAGQTDEEPKRIWANFAKGGEYSPHFQDVHLLLNWGKDGSELASFEGSVIRNPSFYFNEALTYSERTASGFSPRALPKGCLFDSKGPIIAAVNSADLLPLLGFLMSRPCATFLEFMVAAGDSAVSGTAARQYTQSIVGSVPVPEFDQDTWRQIGTSTKRIWEGQCFKDAVNETSRYFRVPEALASEGGSLRQCSLLDALRAWNLRRDRVNLEILELSLFIENAVRHAYHFDEFTNAGIDREFGKHVKLLPPREVPENEFSRLYSMEFERLVNIISAAAGGKRVVTKKSYFADRKLELLALYFDTNVDAIAGMRAKLGLVAHDEVIEAVSAFVSYLIGIAFGRWDIRFATGDTSFTDMADPFAALSACSPGRLQNERGLPLGEADTRRLRVAGKWDYPLDLPWDGVLVDDHENPNDVVGHVRRVLSEICSERAESVEIEICQSLEVSDFREYIRRPSLFFADHLSRHSKSRRQAPIYWPLSTPSSRYTLWLYYPRLTAQTLHQCIADFLVPKLKGIAAEIQMLRSSNGSQSRLEDLLEMEDELNDMHAEIERIIKLPYVPNPNDGVLITASPLWKLFRLPKWQKDLKQCWEELKGGDYDWAHLALSIWPDRVRQKCKTDRSLAIAHKLENLCELRQPKPKVKKGRGKQESLVKEDAN